MTKTKGGRTLCAGHNRCTEKFDGNKNALKKGLEGGQNLTLESHTTVLIEALINHVMTSKS